MLNLNFSNIFKIINLRALYVLLAYLNQILIVNILTIENSGFFFLITSFLNIGISFVTLGGNKYFIANQNLFFFNEGKKEILLFKILSFILSLIFTIFLIFYQKFNLYIIIIIFLGLIFISSYTIYIALLRIKKQIVKAFAIDYFLKQLFLLVGIVTIFFINNTTNYSLGKINIYVLLVSYMMISFLIFLKDLHHSKIKLKNLFIEFLDLTNQFKKMFPYAKIDFLDKILYNLPIIILSLKLSIENVAIAKIIISITLASTLFMTSISYYYASLIAKYNNNNSLDKIKKIAFDLSIMSIVINILVLLLWFYLGKYLINFSFPSEFNVSYEIVNLYFLILLLSAPFNFYGMLLVYTKNLNQFYYSIVGEVIFIVIFLNIFGNNLINSFIILSIAKVLGYYLNFYFFKKIM